jgi:TetR/AcrR family transcriptional regulator, regulator of autoinduction and epiphytic fitness
MTIDNATTLLALGGSFTDEPSTDGRVARGQRTRRRVAEALVSLLAEGETDPTAKAIAERAGVSLRLVFHHFADMDDLYCTVAFMQLELQRTALPVVSSSLPLAQRINDTVQHRSDFFEEISPVRRAAVRRSVSSPGVLAVISVGNSQLADGLAAIFSPELDALTDEDHEALLAALDSASSWEAWERMRHGAGLNTETSRLVVIRTLSALLTQPA